MVDNNTRRVQILERAFEIMEEAILNDLGKDEEQTRSFIDEDFKLRHHFAEDKREEEAVEEAYRKLCDLSFSEIQELYEVLKEDLDEKDEEDEDVSELFKKYIEAKEDDIISYIDVDGEEKSYVVKAKTSLKEGYFALLFPLHKLPNHEIPFSKYQKFVFGDGDVPDHFELVTDEKIIAKLNRMFDDF